MERARTLLVAQLRLCICFVTDRPGASRHLKPAINNIEFVARSFKGGQNYVGAAPQHCTPLRGTLGRRALLAPPACACGRGGPKACVGGDVSGRAAACRSHALRQQRAT